MIETTRMCMYCVGGTMQLVRKSPNCMRWVCTDCFRTYKIDMSRVNQELNIGKLTKKH